MAVPTVQMVQMRSSVYQKLLLPVRKTNSELKYAAHFKVIVKIIDLIAVKMESNPLRFFFLFCIENVKSNIVKLKQLLAHLSLLCVTTL